MYKDHVLKSLVIIFCIFFSFLVPFLFLVFFYANHFTFVFGNMFSKVFVFIKYHYYGYVYVSKTIHSGAMLAVYFYIIFCLFLLTLSFLFIKFFLKSSEKNIQDYCVVNNKRENFSLDVLDDKKRLK